MKIRLGAYRFRRVRLCTDKATSETWARLLQNAVDRKSAREAPQPEKLKDIPRRCLDSLGLVSLLATKRRATWAESVTDYVSELRTAGRNGKYLDNVERYLSEVGRGCGWQTLHDVGRDDFAAFLVRRQKRQARDPKGSTDRPLKGTAPRTLRDIQDTVKAFIKWAVRAQRVDGDPLASIRRVDATRDRRRRRRAFTDAEIPQLLAHSGDFELAVRMALGTGLRRRELVELEWRDLRLDGDDAERPHLALRPEATKAKRADVLPLAPDLARRLKAARPTFSLPTARVLKAVPTWDEWVEILEQAGIDYTDPEGRIAGFHSLRVTFISHLQRAGLSPQEVMELARHTDWKLTSQIYTDKRFVDTFGAIKRLPTFDRPQAGAVRKTGTDDAPVTQDQIQDQNRFPGVPSGSLRDGLARNETPHGGAENAGFRPSSGINESVEQRSSPTRGVLTLSPAPC